MLKNQGVETNQKKIKKCNFFSQKQKKIEKC